MGYVPIEIEQQGGNNLSRELKIPVLSDRIKLKDVAVFSRQFATMINSGLSLLRSLYILAEQTESKPLADGRQPGAHRRRDGVRRCRRRWPSTRRRSTASTSSMVRAGEAGGVLDSVLHAARRPRSRSRSSCAAR